MPRTCCKIEVECDSETQVREAMAAGADAILLDNMTPDAAAQRRRADSRAGAAHDDRGVGQHRHRPARLAAVAATGVDLISLGALTHSAPNFDVALEFES